MIANIDVLLANDAKEERLIETTVDLDGCAVDTLQEVIDAKIADLGDGWTVEYIELTDVDGFDDDDSVTAHFEGLKFDINELDKFAVECDEHCVAYELRYLDIGDNDFEDSYNGCWDSEASFAHNVIDECYAIPDPIRFYIDYEKWARDVMMDYSSYTDSCGDLHIFRD